MKIVGLAIQIDSGEFYKLVPVARLNRNVCLEECAFEQLDDKHEDLCTMCDCLGYDEVYSFVFKEVT